MPDFDLAIVDKRTKCLQKLTIEIDIRKARIWTTKKSDKGKCNTENKAGQCNREWLG